MTGPDASAADRINAVVIMIDIEANNGMLLVCHAKSCTVGKTGASRITTVSDVSG